MRSHLVTATCRLNLFASIARTMAKGSKWKKRLSLLPAMPLDVLFEVQKKTFYHAHCLSNSSNFLASQSQGHHPPVPNKSNFPGYSHDENCHHRLEGCKGAIRGAGVPLEYEQATVLFFCSGTVVRFTKHLFFFFYSSSVLTSGLNDLHRVVE